MTVLERKAKLVAAILNDTNERRFLEIESFYKNLSLVEPCVYSLDELEKSLDSVELDFAEGKGIPHEEIIRRYAL